VMLNVAPSCRARNLIILTCAKNKTPNAATRERIVARALELPTAAF
jgi:hypothetical protein